MRTNTYTSITALVIFTALALYNADQHIYAVLPISVAILVVLGRYLLLRRQVEAN